MTGKGLTELDPRLTFESFVVGPANRLAAAAARRAAESPGTAYNPLFLYSASGLGKSHILGAISSSVAENHPDRATMYQTLEGYLDELAKAIKSGSDEAIRDRYTGLGVLLLDDVQFVAGHPQAQELLLRTLDTLTDKGAQIVLASDRPPAQIDGLDERLLSRFSGGLIVDIGPPDYETKVAIVRKKAEGRGVVLGGGVAEALSRLPLSNVRDLQGALNRVVAAQELEGRPVAVEDVAVLTRDMKGIGSELDEAPSGPRQEPPPAAAPSGASEVELDWRMRVQQVIEAAAAARVSADRLVGLLHESEAPDDWDEVLEQYETRLHRIAQMRRELKKLGDPWPEATAVLLANPDRIEEAEGLVASARELRRPFALLPEGPPLSGLAGDYPALAVKAAEQLIQGAPSAYNPLFLHSPDADRSASLLQAVGRGFEAAHPTDVVGMISVPEFAEEFIRAIQAGVSGAWRERWWGVDVLLLTGLELLSSTERAQEEIFHLFEALGRRGGRIVLAADRPPGKIAGVDDRLASRFEGGLVVDLGGTPRGSVSGDRPGIGETRGAPGAATAGALSDEGEGAGSEAPPRGTDDLAAVRDLAGVGYGRTSARGSHPGEASAGTRTRGPLPAGWVPSPEKVIWSWPDIEERIADATTQPGEAGAIGH